MSTRGLRGKQVTWRFPTQSSWRTLLPNVLCCSHDTDYLVIARDWARGDRQHWGIVYVAQHRLSIGERVRRLAEYDELLTAQDMLGVVEYLQRSGAYRSCAQLHPLSRTLPTDGRQAVAVDAATPRPRSPRRTETDSGTAGISA